MTTITSQPTSRRAIVISWETAAYILVMVVAVGLRAIALGRAPLDPYEASHASAAYAVVDGNFPAGGTVESVLLFVLSLVSFTIAGASNAAARIWPLLAGLGLVLSPLLLRRRLGRASALIASAALAIAPAAVGTSRRLNGSIFVLLALMLALALVDHYLSDRRTRNVTWLGVLVGVALLADSGALVAVLTIIIGFGFAVLTDEEGLLTSDEISAVVKGVPWGVFTVAILATAGVVASAFFISPNGIGEAANHLSRFLYGFARRVPDVIYPGFGLAIYEPGLLVFGLYGAWLCSQSPSPRERLLAGWGLAGVIAVLAYPGARPEHLLWAVVPLALLAGLGVDAIFARRLKDPAWTIWLQAILFVALAAMIWASLAHHLAAPRILPIPGNAAPGEAVITIPLDLVLVLLWLILLGAVILAGSSFWGLESVLRGLALGGLLLAIGVEIGQSGSLAWTRFDSPYEPLNVAPAQPGLNRLVNTVADIGKLSTGQPLSASIALEEPGDLLLPWSLRDFENLAIVEHADPRVESVMVITPAGESAVALGSNYVGQDFVIARSWQPGGLNVADAIRWIMYRRAPAPTGEQRVILWVREDIYRLVPAGGEPASQ